MKTLEYPSYDLSKFIPPVQFSGRGTNTEGDVLTQTVDGRDLNSIWSEFQETLRAHNTERQVMVDLLTHNVSEPIEDVPVASTVNFERASEFGVPKGIRGVDYFQMGYSLEDWDIAVRFTFRYLANALAGQVEQLHNQILEADSRNIFDGILRAVFNNTNRVADIRNQAINVYPFYNADGTVPPAYKNNTFSGSESHYLVSGASTVDSGDIDEMLAKLSNKGYGPLKGLTVVLLANTPQVDVIRNFRVSTGAKFDFIPAQGRAPFLVAGLTGIQGEQIADTYQGLSVAGSYGNVIVIEEDYIPANYLLMFATGGENQVQNPIGFREMKQESLRGLTLVKGQDPDYPLIESYYFRAFGTGIRHRGAGVVMQIKATGTYDIPAAYV